MDTTMTTQLADIYLATARTIATKRAGQYYGSDKVFFAEIAKALGSRIELVARVLVEAAAYACRRYDMAPTDAPCGATTVLESAYNDGHATWHLVRTDCLR